MHFQSGWDTKVPVAFLLFLGSRTSQTPRTRCGGKFLEWNRVLGRPNRRGKSSLVHPRGTREDQAIVCQHPGWALDYTVTMIWSRGFRVRSGTVASLLGYPTGSSISSFSFVGRSRRSLSRGPQLRGVVVTVTSPAFCNRRGENTQASEGEKKLQLCL